MLRQLVSTFFLLCLLLSQTAFGDNVGLLIMATGKYIRFVPPLIESAQKYFCTEHDVTFFVFTDGQLPPEAQAENIVTIFQPRLGWPYDTMMRYHAYSAQYDLLISQDYLFACDADMRFVDNVGNEILSERVATLHPGFVGQRGSYEKNKASKAGVAASEGIHYYAGGFYGGTAKEVLHIAQTNAKNIDIDLSKGIIAVWHDESHWNRYCIDNKPTLILSPSYCYPERWNLPYPKKLLALDKNHAEYQTPL